MLPISTTIPFLVQLTKVGGNRVEVKLREKDGGKEVRRDRREKDGGEGTTGLPILERKHDVKVDVITNIIHTINLYMYVCINEKFAYQYH